MNNKLKYISLFSSAGIGCFGFKKAGFDCIATCEYLEKRLKIQKYNNKCKFDSGYILGDLTQENVQNKIFIEIEKWDSKNNVDVVVATPPCQGMSVANQKKKNELKRNSLVVTAIQLVKKINPKIFIFENVSTFLKTLCNGNDNVLRTISDEINKELSNKYIFSSKVINFKNYGSNSSRTRTLVIGVRKDQLNILAPYELFPSYTHEKILKDVIGSFPSLKEMGSFWENNVLHHFKEYNPKMLEWIKYLEEGQSAFDNILDINKPHRVINGKIHVYSNKFGDKYKRQCWNKVAPCIHTANDCLASQNTIHPVDNRVFSIAELMEMMTIPKEFMWDKFDPNLLSNNEKIKWLKKHQSNIRQCIGESVPTNIFYQIANNIKSSINNHKKIINFENEIIEKYSSGSYYTNKIHLSYIFNYLPDFPKKNITILEPSVGGGSFINLIFKKYENYDNVTLILNDISLDSINFCKKLLKDIKIPKNFKIIFSNEDYLNFSNNYSIDLIIGNPPFIKTNKINYVIEFWKKSLELSKHIYFINPKYILDSPPYEQIREILYKYVNLIIDFGEIGFRDAKIETIFIGINRNNTSKQTHVISVNKNIDIYQKNIYIFDKKLPHWIIYRCDEFDKVWNSMKKNIFTIYKNYEISNSMLSNICKKNYTWVVRSKNINYYEPKLEHIPNYDKFIDNNLINQLKFKKFFLSQEKLFLIPNLTYYPRIIKMPNNIIVNGSVIIAKLNDNEIFTEKDILYYYSNEYRIFFNIAFNYATRSLNINNRTIIFYGRKYT